MLTRFWFDSSSVARKGSVGTVTVKQASGQPEQTHKIPGQHRVYASNRRMSRERYYADKNQAASRRGSIQQVRI